MSLKKSDEFKGEAVQLALTSGLARKQVAAPWHRHVHFKPLDQPA